MNRYSAIVEGEGASNTVCETTDAIISAVQDGLEYAERITIVKIPADESGKPETVQPEQE